jgi:hypothetical protein
LEIWDVENVWPILTSFFFVQVWKEPAREQLSCSEDVGGYFPSSVHPKVGVEAWEG